MEDLSMKRGLSFILILLFMVSIASFPTIPTVTASISGNNPPSSGNWIINSTTIVEDEIITVNGSIIINSTASFTNTTLIINSTSTSNYMIEVTSNGNLTMQSCTIKAANSLYTYYVKIQGIAFINYTSFYDIGLSFGTNGDSSGLWINSDKTVKIHNSFINSTYNGLYIYYSSNVDIYNVSILANNPSSSIGLHSEVSSGIIKDISVDSKYGGVEILSTAPYFESISITTTNSYPLHIKNGNNIYMKNLNLESVSGLYPYLEICTNVTLENIHVVDSTPRLPYPIYISNSNHINIYNLSASTNYGPYISLSHYINFENLSLYAYNPWAIWASSDILIMNSNITHYYNVIQFSSSYNMQIINCNIISTSSSNSGFYSTDSHDIIINNSLVVGGSYGINLNNVDNLNLNNVSIHTSDLGIYGINLENLTGINVRIQGPRGVAIYNSHNVSFKNANINATSLGIQYSGTSGYLDTPYVNVTTGDAIIIRESSSITINHPTLIASSRGINGINSSDVYISYVDIQAKYGIYFTNVSYSTIYYGSIVPVNESMVFVQCLNLSVSYIVSLSGGSENGIRLLNTSNSVFTYNRMYNFHDYGILVLDNSTNNLFYNNYFYKNNGDQVQVYDKNTGNHWDNGTKGNWYFNYNGYDSDGDGIGEQPYAIDGGNNLDHHPIVIDADHDGLNDGSESSIYHTNATNPDSDNDGLTDGYELFVSFTDPLNNDTDSDGMPDGWEVQYGLNATKANAGDDDDHDGLTNMQEYQLGTNPSDNDTDGDGMPDAWEVANNLNPTSNDAAEDPDNDGLTNLQEYQHLTNPANNDTDSDGMPDGWEVQYSLDPLNNSDATLDADNDGLNNLGEFQHNGNPHDNDTDDDGMPDAWEAQYGFNLNNATDKDADPDGDQLTNLQEYQIGTNPLVNDTDGDGMPDGWEVQYGLNATKANAGDDDDHDGLTNMQEYQLGTNPSNNDTDGDGMPDAWEVANNLNPTSNDAAEDPDNDNLTNIAEFEHGTNPQLNDTDHDGLLDGAEVYEYQTDPLNPDTDNDGIPDGQEVLTGTNPTLADTDGDGIIDSQDFLPLANNYLLFGGIVAAVIVSIVVIYFIKKSKKVSTKSSEKSE